MIHDYYISQSVWEQIFYDLTYKSHVSLGTRNFDHFLQETFFCMDVFGEVNLQGAEKLSHVQFMFVQSLSFSTFKLK